MGGGSVGWRARFPCLSQINTPRRHILYSCGGLFLQLSVRCEGELRTRGSSVETIFPDSNPAHMLGANAMDLSLRPPAARAGYNQGRVLTR
jgi:hypothetical protein